jgi:uncharacterized protein
MPTLHESVVPALRRYLRQLDAMLAAAEQHTARHHTDPRALLNARLHESMQPLHDQVCIAANFAFRLCAPLIRSTAPPYPDVPATFHALRRRVAEAIAWVDGLSPHSMQGAESLLVTDIAGQAEVHLSGARFAHEYALPNFLFHLCMAYAILRHAGVPLGKADFDGFHLYR